MKMNAVSASGISKNWEAEEDARTLAQAAVIRSDPKRFARARQAAQEMGRQKMVEARALVGLGRMRKK
jgi:hypothetical protein